MCGYFQEHLKRGNLKRYDKNTVHDRGLIKNSAEHQFSCFALHGIMKTVSLMLEYEISHVMTRGIVNLSCNLKEY